MSYVNKRLKKQRHLVLPELKALKTAPFFNSSNTSLLHSSIQPQQTNSYRPILKHLTSFKACETNERKIEQAEQQLLPIQVLRHECKAETSKSETTGEKVREGKEIIVSTDSITHKARMIIEKILTPKSKLKHKYDKRHHVFNFEEGDINNTVEKSEKILDCYSMTQDKTFFDLISPKNLLSNILRRDTPQHNYQAAPSNNTYSNRIITFREVMNAARNGNTKIIRKALQAPSINLRMPVNITDIHGNSVLHIAAQNNRRHVAKLYLKFGGDVNIQNKAGSTALHYCMAYDHHNLAQFLVKKGASTKLKNNCGQVSMFVNDYTFTASTTTSSSTITIDSKTSTTTNSP